MDGALDYEAIESRVLRPERPGAARVLAEVRGVLDRRAAWERLAPPSWLGDPARDFGFGERVPPSVRAAVALCTDARGVATAEALAREIATALVPWGGRPPARIEWRFIPPRKVRQSDLREASSVSDAAESASASASYVRPPRPLDAPAARLALRRRMSAEQRVFAHDAYAHESWAHARAVGGVAGPYPGPFPGSTVAPEPAPPLPAYGRAFTAVRDPFAPLMALWALGYALHSIREDTPVLVCPEG